MKIKNLKNLISFPVGEKSVIWIRKTNKYVIAEPLAAEILQSIENDETINNIVAGCKEKYEISENVCRSLVEELSEQWNTLNSPEEAEKSISKEFLSRNEIVTFSKKYYRINETVFFVEYETLAAEQINHPKFGHLEIKPQFDFDHKFQVFDDGKYFVLYVNDEYIGKWKNSDSHFASGKFSMQVIQKIYEKDEKQWTGVFHAAGISDGEKCILFYGESGNGKSTLSALLMAAGLDVLSDDFLPVENESGLVFRFPAALSIKNKAYDLVTSLFPDLKNAEEYQNPALQKTFRYLAPENRSLDGVPCKATIFVKYDKSIDFSLEKLDLEEALTYLIPDSWINPSEESARQFMKWVSNLKHYRLTYSDNERMVSAIKEMLDELS